MIINCLKCKAPFGYLPDDIVVGDSLWDNFKSLQGHVDGDEIKCKECNHKMSVWYLQDPSSYHKE